MIKNILIIDDEVDLCEMVKKNLEAVGEFHVRICTDRRKWKKCVNKQVPDVILIDVIMPYLTGPEIVKELEKDILTKSVPIIYFTGVGVSAEECNGHIYLEKPVKIKDLVRVINNV